MQHVFGVYGGWQQFLCRRVMQKDFLVLLHQHDFAVWLCAVVCPGCPAGALQSLINVMLHLVVVVAVAVAVVVVVCCGGPVQSVSH